MTLSGHFVHESEYSNLSGMNYTSPGTLSLKVIIFAKHFMYNIGSTCILRQYILVLAW